MVDVYAADVEVAQHEPYVGPLALSEENGIYGRDRELRELYNLLITERIVLLYSPSGAGKSSIIQAGLIPRLRGRPVRQYGENQELATSQRPYFEVVPIARFGAELPAEYAAVGHISNLFVLKLLASLEQGRGDDALSPAELAGLTLPDYVHLRYGDRKVFLDEEPEMEQPRPRANRMVPAGVVWIFDQFEDVLTVDPLDIKAKHEFFEQLGLVLGNRKRWALFSMREDYLGQIKPFRSLLPGRLRATYRLTPLGPMAAAQSIREPAKAAGVPFTDEAVERLVGDLQTAVIQLPDGRRYKGLGPYIEPVQLQVVCRRIWDQLPAGAQQIDVGQITDVSTALTEYYAESVAEVASKCKVNERRVRDWFERLITPQDTRGQVPLELEGEHILPPDAIGALVDKHLVRRDNRLGTNWFELSHDTMIEPVRRDNERWREKHLNTLQKRAPVWENSGRPPGMLLVGAELREARRQMHEAERAARGDPAEIRKVERAFLEASSQAAAARHRKFLGIGALFSILLTALIVVLYFWNLTQAAKEQAVKSQTRAMASEATAVAERREARQQRAIAQVQKSRADAEANLAVSRALSIAASARLKDRLDLSLLLSVESRTFHDTVEAHFSIYSALAQGAQPEVATPRLAAFLWGQPRWAYAVAFSPNGRTLASAGDDGAIWMWDTQTHKLIGSLAGHDGRPVTGLAFGPDGATLASSGWDNKVRLWDLGSARELIAFEGHTDYVTAVAFGPDGKLLVSTGREGTVRLWDPVARAPLDALPGGHQDAALAVAFSPNGKGSIVYTGGDDGFVRRWNLTARQEITPALSVSTKPIRAIAFSPQGDRFAAAGEDGEVRLWNVEATGRDVDTTNIEPQIIPGREGIIKALAFSPDGQTLFWAGQAKTIHAWNLANSEEYTLTGHTGMVNALGLILTADHRMLLASAGFGSEAEGATPVLSDVRLWDVTSTWPTTTTLDYRGSAVASTSLTHDGRVLASGGVDGVIRLWDLPSGAPHGNGNPLFGHGAAVSELAFSPLDGTLASIGTDGQLLLWSQPWENPPGELESGGEVALRPPRLAFDPSGRTLAVAYGTQITIWDIKAGQARKSRTFSVRPQLSDISALRFSPDGTVLAAGVCLDSTTGPDCASGGLSLWKMPEGQTMAGPPPIAGTEVAALAFSADGRTLATAYFDSKIRLWDWPTLERLGPPLEGHRGPVTALAFSPDSRMLGSTSEDGTLRLWPARGGLSNPPLWGTGRAKNDLVFSPDGRLLAVAGKGTPALRLLDVDPDSWVRRACAIANRNLNALEWAQYLPADLERRATCPDLPLDAP